MARMPRIFVIGQAGSIRTQSFFAHAKSVGFEAELSPAVILTGECPWSEHYDHVSRLSTMGYGLNRGEVGCFLAHRKVWQKIVEGTDRVCLVLEDDARWVASPDADIALAMDAIAGRTMLIRLLSQPRRSYRIWRQLSSSCSLYLPTRASDLSVAYLITQEAAARLLQASERFIWPVDRFFNFGYLHGVDVLHLGPEKVRHEDTDSLIGKRTKPIASWTFRLKRECIRAIQSVRVAWAYQQTLGRLGLRLKPIWQPSVKETQAQK
jgi:glycosyl transferase family 25